MDPIKVGARLVQGGDRIRLTGRLATFRDGTGLARYFAMIEDGMTVEAFIRKVEITPPVNGRKRASAGGLLDNYWHKSGLIRITAR
jgi:hypothetical protein